MRKIFVCFAVMVLAGNTIAAQTPEDPLITDGPDATESAFTVPQVAISVPGELCRSHDDSSEFS